MVDAANIQECFFSMNSNNTFNFVILFENGKVIHRVKKMIRIQNIRKDKFDGIPYRCIKKMTCNHFTNYINDYVKIYDSDTHFVFVIIAKSDLYRDLCFKIKK